MQVGESSEGKPCKPTLCVARAVPPENVAPTMSWICSHPAETGGHGSCAWHHVASSEGDTEERSAGKRGGRRPRVGDSLLWEMKFQQSILCLIVYKRLFLPREISLECSMLLSALATDGCRLLAVTAHACFLKVILLSVLGRPWSTQPHSFQV